MPSTTGGLPRRTLLKSVDRGGVVPALGGAGSVASFSGVGEFVVRVTPGAVTTPTVSAPCPGPRARPERVTPTTPVRRAGTQSLSPRRPEPERITPHTVRRLQTHTRPGGAARPRRFDSAGGGPREGTDGGDPTRRPTRLCSACTRRHATQRPISSLRTCSVLPAPARERRTSATDGAGDSSTRVAS